MHKMNKCKHICISVNTVSIINGNKETNGLYNQCWHWPQTDLFNCKSVLYLTQKTVITHVIADKRGLLDNITHV